MTDQMLKKRFAIPIGPKDVVMLVDTAKPLLDRIFKIKYID